MGETRRRFRPLTLRNIVLAGSLLLAVAGLGLGLSQACQDNPTRDEEIRNYKRTITASERRIDRARTAIAVLTQTPVK